MNKRTTEILRIILNNEHSINIEELSTSFEVSVRTIKNDINTINNFLASNGMKDQLVITPQGNISYAGDKEKTQEIVLEKGADFYTYRLDKEERKQIISLLLLNSIDYITISAIADEILISRQTIINDLEEVKNYFISFNLKIQSNSNKGLRVAGYENEKRRMILAILYTNLTPSDGSINAYNPFTLLILSTLFKNQPKKIFERIIKAEENRNNSFFTDASYTKVLYYCMLIVERMKEKRYCTVEIKEHNSKYEMSLEIIQYLGNYFNIEFVDDEVIALSNIIKQQRFIRSDSQNDSDTIKIQMIATRFISAVSLDLNVNLNVDFILFENLISHLETTLVRVFDESDRNPVLDILMQNYLDIFEIARRHIHIFNEYMGREMNDHELSYVVMHICAAMERKKNLETPAKVVVVCGARIGTSQLLVEKLKQQFKFDIIEVTSVHHLNQNLIDQADLIISTVALPDIEKDHVIITSMLNDSDYLKIHKKLKLLDIRGEFGQQENHLPYKALMNEYQPIIEKYLSSEIADALISELRKVTTSFFQSEEPVASGAYLYELLKQDHILLDIECADYRAAIQAGGKLLVDSGAITPAYIDAMLRNVEENGPYFVISKGFAVPHAPIDESVCKTGMSLIRLKEPITFYDKRAGEIKFVCCLSATDAESHTKALFDLINMLDNESFREALTTCETPEKMAAAIEWYEEEICGIF